MIITGSGELISVWGSHGMGKTTLVRAVYNSQEVSERFQMRAYVKLMRPFILEELVRSLVIQLGVGRARKTFSRMPLLELTEELAKLFARMKCLIVLDDVSSIEDADKIIGVFRNMWSSSSSTIIVTTREVLIAKHCSEERNIYRLKPLSDEDALDLFTRKVHKKYYDAPLFLLDICIMQGITYNRSGRVFFPIIGW
jgi:hypothetical protein